MGCGDHTRWAGSETSQFVDVQGGGIWRANFYLQRKADAVIVPQSSNEKELTPQEKEDKPHNYLSYDEAWLATQSNAPEWVYPAINDTPSKPSINVGIKHPVGAAVTLYLNGSVVSSKNLVARDTDAERRVMMTRWKGLEILPGTNEFTGVVRSGEGKIIETIHRQIHFVSNIARASVMTEQSNPIADGKTPPVLAVRLEDEAGRPVHAGREAKITIDAPYALYSEDIVRNMARADFERPVAGNIETRQFVGHDGTIKLKLRPTLQTGKLTANVTLDNGRIIPVSIYLKPEKRDWIVVGLATGSINAEKLSQNIVAADLKNKIMSSNGRFAFFAKGLIKGEWLLTMSVDTDRKRGNRDGDFLTEIDPNAYYTLYGDRSTHTFDGTSRYPLFVKLERESAYALFGDYTTNISEAKLTPYNRKLSGLQAGYQTETTQVQAFAAETNQGFAKDEIAANGTSGIYRLSNQHILAQSETVIVETRDRLRPDVVLERRELTRFIDYTLDYLTGELLFKFPVDVSDAGFNPNVIIVDYETSEDAERNITFGGRVQKQIANKKVRIGATAVSEGGSSQTANTRSRLVGVDAVAQINDTTEIRAEFAVSDNSITGSTEKAILAEVVHTNDRLNAEAYLRQEDAGFGLGQTNSNTNAVRRVGGRANYKISEFTTEDNSRRGTRSVEAAAYREDNLSTGDSRDVGEVSFKHKTNKFGVSAGLRAAKDKFTNKDDRHSVLALAQLDYALPKQGINLQISHEQPLSANDEVSAFPQRTKIGVDKSLGPKATVNLRHEILNGATTQAQNTSIGLTVSPWSGSVLTGATDMVTNDSTKRLGATLGLDQQVRLSEKWSASLGLRNRKILDEGGDYVEVAPDAAVSPLESNEDFTSGYLGVGYKTDKMVGSARGEMRTSSSGDTHIATVSVARELSEKLSVAGASRYSTSTPSNGSGRKENVDMRVGVSWRPRDKGLIVFNRLDIATQSDGTKISRTKIVNNLAANAMVTDKLQLSANHGIKYITEELRQVDYESLTNLIGAEARFDISSKVDIGLRGSVIFNDKGRTQYSYGPSIGVSPVKNVWMSVGYNVDGYNDDDFAAAEYARKGAYLNMRFKFDQNTVKGLLRRISPDSRPVY